MPFIDSTYFDGEFLLNIGSSAVLQASVDAAIATHEDDYLRQTLGLSLYNAFLDGIAAEDGGFSDQFSDQFDHGSLEDRWRWLRDGHTYNDQQGRPQRWIGLVNARKQSPIAGYVYFMYRANNVSTTVSTGETVAATENSTIISPDRKMVFAWNRMAEWNRELFYMLANLYDTDGHIVYPEPELCELKMQMYTSINVFGI